MEAKAAELTALAGQRSLDLGLTCAQYAQQRRLAMDDHCALAPVSVILLLFLGQLADKLALQPIPDPGALLLGNDAEPGLSRTSSLGQRAAISAAAAVFWQALSLPALEAWPRVLLKPSDPIAWRVAIALKWIVDHNGTLLQLMLSFSLSFCSRLGWAADQQILRFGPKSATAPRRQPQG